MHAHSRRGRRWRRLSRKYEVMGLVGFLIVVAVALVGLLIYLMSSSDYRMRY
jgi:hypothetical protein